MTLNLLTGIPVMIACLLVQALIIAFCARHYVRFRGRHERGGWLVDTLLLSGVMLLMLFASFAQTFIWATLFMLLGEFEELPTALYYSAVNFFTLGYGDIVMSPRWRLLGPLEAAHGILMFGLSAAVMTAAVTDVVKCNRLDLQKREEL